MELSALNRARMELARQDYSILPPDTVLTRNERAAIEALVFGGEMEHDLPNVHSNRDRLDDVVHFEWSGGQLCLSEAPANHPDASRINIDLTKNFPAPRNYKRIWALQLDPLRKLIEQILRLVPNESRRSLGQVGVHAVQTYDKVVANWHRDGSPASPVDWVIAYVVSRIGGGARSCLAVERGGDIVAGVELAPGQLLMHRDDSYYHYVTPLTSSAEVPYPRRSTVVMMVRPRIDTVSPLLRGPSSSSDAEFLQGRK